MLYDALLDSQLSFRPFAISTLCPSLSGPGSGVAIPAAIGALASPVTSMTAVVRRAPVASGSMLESGHFNGSTAYYERSDNSAFSCHAGASGVIAIEFVAQLSAYGASGSWYVSKWNTSPVNAEFLVFHGTTGIPGVIFGTSAGATVMSVNSTLTLALNRRYHIAVEYDRAAPRCSIFVNGHETRSTTASGTTSDTTMSLMIGRRHDGTRYLNGNMSHMAFYNRTLGRAVWQQHTDLMLNGVPYAA